MRYDYSGAERCLEQGVRVAPRKAEALTEAGKRFAKGNMARVEVTGVRQLKDGRTVLELKPGARRENR